MARLLPEFWSADITGENKEHLKECFEAYRRLLVDVFKEALSKGEILEEDAEVLAHLLISMLDGIALYWVTLEEGSDLDGLVRKGLDVFLRGIQWQGVAGEC
ncbi:MAG: TetR family transcriptional regulator C-terminal domain-containing protein [Firmicutes bacterium]|nr:TetR family transcriptional regulator C-terminal domain-containing protein [Bacillota bacterium]